MFNEKFSLFNTCKPRIDILNDKSSDKETLNISTWMDVDAEDFFARNYITEGMSRLASNVFNRLNGRTDAPSIIKLTQAMGGGKTHNMVMLSLLSQYPNYRKLILNKYEGRMDKVKVVIVDGRNTHPYGIWGTVAAQLGKEDIFKDFYSPLKYPGTNNWIELLKDSSVLILIDELPFYLNATAGIPVGYNDNLASVTQNALITLFQAVQQLDSACLVISSLQGNYEKSTKLIDDIFNLIEKELDRNCLSLTPVDSSNNDIYHILRKQLFESTIFDDSGSKYIVSDIALEYRKHLDKYKNTGYDVLNPSSIQIQIEDSFPFHPSLKYLYERFKNNENFQQTRGLIKLMKHSINYLFSINPELSKSQMLINCFDFDFSDNSTIEEIHKINSSLSAALSKDIYSSNGTSTLQELSVNEDLQSALSIGKIIYMSSLSSVTSSVRGLTESEILTYLGSPTLELKNIKEVLDAIVKRCWYLHKNGSTYYFKNQKNLTAEISDTIRVTSDENAIILLKAALSDKFFPKEETAYSKLLVFPTIDDIDKSLKKDSTTLIIYKPERNSVPLSQQLNEIYNNIYYKNRVCFLTCDTVQHYEELIDIAKEKFALDDISKRYAQESDAVASIQNELSKRCEENAGKLKQRLNDCVVLLKYPISGGVLKDVTLSDKEYNGEQAVIDVLLKFKKLIKVTDMDFDVIRKRIQRDLFIYNMESKTVLPTTWSDVRERAATNTSFYFIDSNTLETLKGRYTSEDIWREEDGYIKVGPFKNKTNVRHSFSDDKVLIHAEYCTSPEIHISYGNDVPTVKSPILNNDSVPISKDNLVMHLLCVDTSGDNETGDYVTVTIKPEIKAEIKHVGTKQFVSVTCSVPDMPIYYTVDGSNVENSTLQYEEAIEIPVNGFVLLQARYNNVSSERVRVDWLKDTDVLNRGPKRNLPVTITKMLSFNDSRRVSEFLNCLKKVDGKISLGTISVIDKSVISDSKLMDVMLKGRNYTSDDISNLLNYIREQLLSDVSCNVFLTVKKLNLDVASQYDELNLDKLTNLSPSEWQQ